MAKYLTVKESAKLLQVDPSRIRHLCRQKRLHTKVIDKRTYQVSLASLEAYARSPRKAGRPPHL